MTMLSHQDREEMKPLVVETIFFYTQVFTKEELFKMPYQQLTDLLEWILKD